MRDHSTGRPLDVGSVAFRVLMVHWDGAGNIPPQRALARELVRRGHQVHVLTHESLAEAVRSDQAVYHALEAAPQWDFAVPHTLDQEMQATVQNICGSSDFALDFRRVLNTVQPDICVIDSMLVTTMHAAIEKSVRFAAFHHLAWAPRSVCAGLLDSIAGELPGTWCGSQWWDLVRRTPLLLATSYAELSECATTPFNLHFVGPIREPAGSTAWPNHEPKQKRVLVSLSSGHQGQEAVLRNICAALSRLPVRTIVTTGLGVTPATLSDFDQLEVRSFIPHDALLPSADLVVTHAGLGTAMFALGHGVPCLCLPNGRDQNDNAARLAKLGVARVLPTTANPEQIATEVAAMLADENVRQNAQAFAARVERFGQLARAADLVEALVQVWPQDRGRTCSRYPDEAGQVTERQAPSVSDETLREPESVAAGTLPCRSSFVMRIDDALCRLTARFLSHLIDSLALFAHHPGAELRGDGLCLRPPSLVRCSTSGKDK